MSLPKMRAKIALGQRDRKDLMEWEELAIVLIDILLVNLNTRGHGAKVIGIRIEQFKRGEVRRWILRLAELFRNF